MRELGRYHFQCAVIEDVDDALVHRVTMDEAIVLDTSCALLLDREQPSVLISSEDRDNVIKNLVTVLTEVRLGLAVTDVAGVLKMTLPAAAP